MDVPDLVLALAGTITARTLAEAAGILADELRKKLGRLATELVAARRAAEHAESEIAQLRVELPLTQLRYSGSGQRWGMAIYTASTNSHEEQIWFCGSTEDAFDLVCDLHVAPFTS